MTAYPEVSRGDARQPVFRPAVDVLEDSTGITLLADMPGVAKDKLQVQLEGDSLIIAGDVQLELPEELQATHVEFRLPRYERAFSLSHELDRNGISAHLEQGVLRVRIDKLAQVKPKRIAIQGS